MRFIFSLCLTFVISQVIGVYENILFVILHNLKADCDQDLPTVNEQAALNYVRDAFGISDNKHNELFGRIKPGTGIDDVDSSLFKSSVGQWKIKKAEALKAHTTLIKILLKHELEISQTPRFYWSGKFSFLASSMLSLHSEWLELSEVELLLTKWSAFVDIHLHHPLDLKVFSDILKSMVGGLSDGRRDSVIPTTKDSQFIPSCLRSPSEFSEIAELEESVFAALFAESAFAQDDDVLNVFWKSVATLNESFLQFISKLIEENDLEYMKVMILGKVCQIIRTLKTIEGNRMNLNFEVSIQASIANGASKHISRSLNKEILKSVDSIDRLNELIRALEIVAADYNLASERFEPAFKT